MRENRKHPRVSTKLRCWCEGENVTFYARVGNISEGGLFLRTSTPLARGTKAWLRLEPRGQAELRAEATVVWARSGDGGEQQPGMGLRFEALNDEVRGQLRTIVDAELEVGKGLA